MQKIYLNYPSDIEKKIVKNLSLLPSTRTARKSGKLERQCQNQRFFKLISPMTKKGM